MKLNEHPTVKRFQEAPIQEVPPPVLDSSLLRAICLEAGAADAGFLDVMRPELAEQRTEVLHLLPGTKSVISFVCRMNPTNIQTPARSIANLEFHHASDEVNEVGRRIVARLGERGIRALNAGAAGFPMEMDRWGKAKTWVISHKPIAAAAGLGQMGIHRNVIHPKFGNFILLGTVLVAAPITEQSQPIDYNPCLECKLCVAACPTGAISPDGGFSFTACYTHNYREFMGGFSDWVENIVASKSSRGYRERVSDSETASMWQSLSFGANYKAAYCLAVCPAGEEVIAPFLGDRKGYLDFIVRPLQDKEEIIYVKPDSAEEKYVHRRFPHKQTKAVGNGLRARSIATLLRVMPQVFSPERAGPLDATYHFRFTGDETEEATVIIRDRKVQVQPGLIGKANVTVDADSATWLKFVAKESNLFWALLRRRIRIQGSPRLLLAFGRCFA